MSNAFTVVNARDLAKGDVIRDGIASRIDSIVYHADLDECYIIVTDGNGYGNTLRLSGEAEVARLNWTEEDFEAFLAI